MSFLSNIGNFLWNGAKGFGSMFGFDSSSYENEEAQKWQAEQAQMNRDWQEQMLQKQMDYSTDMWNKTNQYNSASAQMERYRQAGLNPYLMMTNGANAGTATNSGTPSGMSAPSAGSGHSGVNTQPAGQFIKSIAEAKVAKQEERSMQLDNSLKEIELRHRERSLLASIMGQEKDNRSKDIYNEWQGQVYDQTIKQMKQQSATLKSQEVLNMMDTVYKSIEAVNLDSRLKAEIAYNLANTELLKRLHRTEGYKQAQVLQEIMESTAREEGIRLTNEQMRRSAKDILEILKEQNWWYDWNQLTSGVGNVLGGVGSVATGVGVGRMLLPKPTRVVGFGRYP